jgi:hypothetical protein
VASRERDLYFLSCTTKWQQVPSSLKWKGPQTAGATVVVAWRRVLLFMFVGSVSECCVDCFCHVTQNGSRCFAKQRIRQMHFIMVVARSSCYSDYKYTTGFLITANGNIVRFYHDVSGFYPEHKIAQSC